MSFSSFAVSICIFLTSITSFSADKPFCTLVERVNANLLEWREQANCREYDVGEKRLQEPGNVQGKSKYVVQRTSGDTYRVDIPVAVGQLKKTMGEQLTQKSASTETEKLIEERIQLCAQLSSSILRGPYGEKLVLNPVISKKDSPTWFLKNNIVNVVPEGKRAHSRGYPEDIDCLTVIHELLHLVGLVDEYQEDSAKFDGKTYYFNCRVLGPRNSVMNNQEEALESSSLDEYLFHGRVCGVKEGKQVCLTETHTLKVSHGQKVDQARAADMFIRHQDMIDLRLSSTGRTKRADLGLPENITLRYIVDSFEKIPEKPNQGSVLAPAHFRAIVFPSCQKKNAIYNKCAHFAYMGTNESSWTEQGQNCNIPVECQSADWLK